MEVRTRARTVAAIAVPTAGLLIGASKFDGIRALWGDWWIVWIALVFTVGFVGVVALFVAAFWPEDSSGPVKDFVKRQAEREDLPIVHMLFSSRIQSGMSDIEQWHLRFKKNSGAFFLVAEVERRAYKRSETIVGSFIVWPIVSKAVQELDAETLQGVDFGPEHIAGPGEKPAALYISGIVARDKQSAVPTLLYLNSVLQTWESQGVELAYTRPMTEDGLRLVKRYRFLPVNPSFEGTGNVYRHTKAAAAMS